jgi:hypothetical protein
MDCLGILVGIILVVILAIQIQSSTTINQDFVNVDWTFGLVLLFHVMATWQICYMWLYLLYVHGGKKHLGS